MKFIVEPVGPEQTLISFYIYSLHHVAQYANFSFVRLYDWFDSVE
jgi:hypothetical protein